LCCQYGNIIIKSDRKDNENRTIISGVKKIPCRRKFLCLPEDSHFAPQNKEENPLLVRGLAFCSAKQGGFDNG
jgi:hypothetical protein